MHLLGLHHVTAITSRIRENRRFYTGPLGLRLVKRSVNQDDVRAYHLFYADGVGSPGTDMTFFDWPMPPERHGTGSIVRTSFRIDGRDTLEWWLERLRAEGLEPGIPEERFGRWVIDFDDGEGQRLSLVDDGGTGPNPAPWAAGGVPTNRAIRGLGPIHLSVPGVARTRDTLERVMGMRSAGTYEVAVRPSELSGSSANRSGIRMVHVFEMSDGGPHAEVHVVEEPDLTPARQGTGGVHHVAFRCPDSDYDAWAERLDELGVPNSGKVDRFYFRSLYFREPNGILFEIATDGPGFAVDEDAAVLGERVALPPFLEPRRMEIEANLAPLD